MQIKAIGVSNFLAHHLEKILQISEFHRRQAENISVFDFELSNNDMKRVEALKKDFE